MANYGGESVLDVGCGTGVLADYLPDDKYYLGIDLNERFLKFAKKRGKNVMMQDALTFERYSEFDVCFIMDVLHHINPRHEAFVERVLDEVQKRVVICEPFEVPSHPITKKFVRIIDDDGTNQPEDWMDRDTLREFYGQYDPIQINEMGNSMIAVYEK
jgi:SAM-dependent methyltransferase